MSLILLDGMEDMASWVVTGASVVAGRNGNCVRATNALHYVIPAAQESDTVTLGFALKLSGGTINTLGDIVRFLSDSTAIIHDSLRVNANRGLSFLQGSNLRGTTGAGIIVVGTWQYIEVQVKLHDTTGFFTVKVDGTTVLSGTNVDTKTGGTKTTFDSVRFLLGSLGPGVVQDYDDVYLKTGAGETFLGDITVETLYPNGNGAASQWVGSDGNSTDNYLLVDEVGAPVTSDYVGSSTAGQIDEYTLTDLVATSGTIVGVCHQAYAALDAAGSGTFAIVNRRTADTVGATQTVTSTTFRGYHETWTTDPETSAAWTIANVNALQTGVKVI